MQEFSIRFPEGKPYDVVGFGLNAVDHLFIVPSYPQFNSKVAIKQHEVRCGGQVATALVTCARFGLKTKYIGKVGSDEWGTLSLRSIAQEGIDTSSVRIEPGAYNQFAFIIIDERSGERTILWDRDPKLTYREGELKKADVCQGRLLHIDGHDVNASIQAIQWAKEDKGLVSIDIDKVEEKTDALVKDIDFLIGTAGFLTDMTGTTDVEQGLRKLRKLNPHGLLCVTLGAEGAVALWGNELLHSSGVKVKAVDTTGAGDVFHGAFIYGLFQRWTIEGTLRFANATAALSCTQIGARAGIPTLNEVERLLCESA